MAKVLDPSCSIARSLGVLGERWTFLVLREALWGVTRFAQFRERLGIAPDVLTDRLGTLVDYGVLTRRPYQEPGARIREEYLLTPAGRELQVVMGALQQWGDEHLPTAEGPSVVRLHRHTGRPLDIGFVDEDGRKVDMADVVMRPTESYPGSLPAVTS